MLWWSTSISILQAVIRKRGLNFHTRVDLHAEHSHKLHQWCSLIWFHINTASWVTYTFLSSYVATKIQGTVYVIQTLLVGFMSILYWLLYSSWGPGQTCIQFLRAKNIYLLYPRKQWTRTIISYWPIPHFVCSIEALIPWALLSGFVHTNLGNWSTTITYCNST